MTIGKERARARLTWGYLRCLAKFCSVGRQIVAEEKPPSVKLSRGNLQSDRLKALNTCREVAVRKALRYAVERHCIASRWSHDTDAVTSQSRLYQSESRKARTTLNWRSCSFNMSFNHLDRVGRIMRLMILRSSEGRLTNED